MISYALEFIVQLPSAVPSSVKISVPVPVAAIHAQTITPPPPCLTDELICFGSWAASFRLHTFFSPSLCYRFILVSSVHNSFFQNSAAPLRTFWKNVTCNSVELLVCILQCSLCISLHEVSDKDTPASWRLFLVCWTEIFFAIVRILLSSAVEFILGLPVPLWLQSSPVHSFLLITFQTVDCGKTKVWLRSLMVLFWFLSLIISSLTFTGKASLLMLNNVTYRVQIVEASRGILSLY